jgi:hypothetical protein
VGLGRDVSAFEGFVGESGGERVESEAYPGYIRMVLLLWGC